MKRETKKTDIKKLQRFLEEFSWLLSSYSDLDLVKSSRLLDYNKENRISAKIAVGNYESSNPNKHYLVGVLPRLFMDSSIFPTNDDIAQFADTVMNVSIRNYSKKSKYEIIGHIVCNAIKLNDFELTKLVKALARISNGDRRSKMLILTRKNQNFGWNEIIQELSNLN